MTVIDKFDFFKLEVLSLMCIFSTLIHIKKEKNKRKKHKKSWNERWGSKKLQKRMFTHIKLVIINLVQRATRKKNVADEKRMTKITIVININKHIGRYNFNNMGERKNNCMTWWLDADLSRDVELLRGFRSKWLGWSPGNSQQSWRRLSWLFVSCSLNELIFLDNIKVSWLFYYNFTGGL